jgi:hypothetical protein
MGYPISGTNTQFAKSTTGSSGSYVTYEVEKVNPPELKMEIKGYTSSATNGVRKHFPSKIIEWGECSVDMISGSQCAGVVTDMNTSGSAWYKITYPDNSAMTFDAFPSGYKPAEVDEDSGEELLVTATFQPIGTIIIS